MFAKNIIKVTGTVTVTHSNRRGIEKYFRINFFFFTGLLKHRQRHHPDFTYLCHFCEKQFGVRNDLARHMEKHTKEQWILTGNYLLDLERGVDSLNIFYQVFL